MKMKAQPTRTYRTQQKKSNRKEVVNLSLFIDDMILYLKDLEINKKLLDIINTVSRVAGYQINLQKSAAFLYTNNEQTKNEYWKTLHLQ
jgi:hypothetical protein